MASKPANDNNEQRVSDYRSGYSCGYSDAKNGTRVRDKDAACLFFGIVGIPDITPPEMVDSPASLPYCHAGKDGDCDWKNCPQEANNRANYQEICPLADSEAGDK